VHETIDLDAIPAIEKRAVERRTGESMADTNDMRIADRFAIEQTLLRYTRGVDRKNWDFVRSAYHVDAHDDHGNYKGNIDGFIESLVKRHATIEQSTHLISNIAIEFAGPDAALVETYFIVHQRMLTAPGEAVQTEVVGRYVDRFARRDGAWRIARRAVVFEVHRTQPTQPGGGLQQNWVVARRDGKDAMEIARAEMGIST